MALYRMPGEKSRCLPLEATGLLAAAEAAGCGKPDEASAEPRAAVLCFLGSWTATMEVGCFVFFKFSLILSAVEHFKLWSRMTCCSRMEFLKKTLGTNDKCDHFLDRLPRLCKRGVSLMCITSDMNLDRTTWISFLSTTEVWIHET